MPLVRLPEPPEGRRRPRRTSNPNLVPAAAPFYPSTGVLQSMQRRCRGPVPTAAGEPGCAAGTQGEWRRRSSGVVPSELRSVR
jgi:hypothetical protein